MSTERDFSLDAIKGMLVVAMVLIHSSNLFLSNRWLVEASYTYFLVFVSGSWIFIAGFLIGNHYQASFERDALRTTRRLFWRGLRLVAIFVVANMLLGKVAWRCEGSWLSADCHLWRVLVLGDNTDLTFQILEGIGYVLIVAPLYMSAPRLANIIVPLLVVVATAAPQFGYKPTGLTWMLLAGLVGVLIGWAVPDHGLRQLATDPRKRAIGALAGLAAWGVFESMVIFLDTRRSNLAAYLLGIAGMLLFLYCFNAWIEWRGRAARILDLLARYSLLCYLGQMVLLWGWYYLVRDVPVANWFVVSFCVGTIATVLLAYVTDRLRRRHRWFDRLYLGVLG